jgi:hypothetical protein
VIFGGETVYVCSKQGVGPPYTTGGGDCNDTTVTSCGIPCTSDANCAGC